MAPQNILCVKIVTNRGIFAARWIFNAPIAGFHCIAEDILPLNEVFSLSWICLMKCPDSVQVVGEGTLAELRSLGHTFTELLKETEQSYSRQASVEATSARYFFLKLILTF